MNWERELAIGCLAWTLSSGALYLAVLDALTVGRTLAIAERGDARQVFPFEQLE